MKDAQIIEAWMIEEDRRYKRTIERFKREFLKFAADKGKYYKRYPIVETMSYSNIVNHLPHFAAMEYPKWLLQRIVVGFPLEAPNPMGEGYREMCVRNKAKKESVLEKEWDNFAYPYIETGKFNVVPEWYLKLISENFPIQQPKKVRYIFHGTRLNFYAVNSTFSLPRPWEINLIPENSLTMTADTSTPGI